MAEKTFDAVKMVRGIRDRHYELFHDRPLQERLAYYRRKAQEFEAREVVASASIQASQESAEVAPIFRTPR